MAVLDGVKITGNGIEQAVARSVKDQIAREFWRWFKENRDMVLVRRKIVVFTVAIRVSDLYEIFGMLFGPEPI